MNTLKLICLTIIQLIKQAWSLPQWPAARFRLYHHSYAGRCPSGHSGSSWKRDRNAHSQSKRSVTTRRTALCRPDTTARGSPICPTRASRQESVRKFDEGGFPLATCLGRIWDTEVPPRCRSAQAALEAHWHSASLKTYVMKANQKKRLTFGDLIASVFTACSQRRARAIVRFAVNAHVVVFRGERRFVIS